MSPWFFWEQGFIFKFIFLLNKALKKWKTNTEKLFELEKKNGQVTLITHKYGNMSQCTKVFTRDEILNNKK